jgi:hypothetical protein
VKYYFLCNQYEDVREIGDVVPHIITALKEGNFQFHDPSALAPGRGPSQPFKNQAGTALKFARRLKNKHQPVGN